MNRDFSYLQDVLDAACRAAPAEFGAIILLDQSVEAAYLAAYRGYEPKAGVILPAMQVRDPTTSSGRALMHRKLILIPDVETDDLYKAHRPAARLIGFRSVLAAPLTGRAGEPIALLILMFRHPQRNSAAIIRTAMLHANLATLVVEAGRFKDQLERRAGPQSANEVSDRDLKVAIRELRRKYADGTVRDRIRTLGEQYVGGLVTTLEHL